MEVWFITPSGIKKAEMSAVGWNTIRKKMRELGIQRAEVVVWPPREREPLEFGVVEIK